MNRHVAAVAAIVSTLLLSGCGSSYVQQGYVGLLVNNFTGKIDKVLDPGYRIALPVNQHIIQFPVLKQQYVMVQESTEGQHEGDDSVKVNSQEGQAFQIDASVEYRIHDKSDVPALYQQYAMPFDQIVEKYYRSKFRAALVDAFASQPLAFAISGSGRKQVEETCEKELAKDFAGDHVDILQVLVRAVHVPPAIEESIAAKTKAENELVQARTKAQQQVVEAQAEAQARLVRATAEAKANKLLAASLDDRLLRKLAIEKLNDKVEVLAVPPNSFLNFSGTNIQPVPQQK